MFRVTRAWLLAVGLAVSSVAMVAGAGNAAASPPDTASPGGVSSPGGVVSVDGVEAVEGEYIVQLEPSGVADNSVQSAADDLHARVERVMNELANVSTEATDTNGVTDEVMGELAVIDGFGARLSPGSAERLAELPGVAAVYPNTIETLDAPLENPPWGLDRLDQQSLPLDRAFTPPNDGSGVNIYIVDQAILASHIEFARGLGDGVDFVGGSTAGDCALHGTHVAGIAGGVDVGVAKAATLHSVRVFDCGGYSTTFRTMKGLDWVASNAKLPAVVNMSFGGLGGAELKETAIDHLAALGITSVASAGNKATDACKYSPASVPRAITVAASDERDVAADFSNYGKCVDLYAPGVRVTSASYTGPEAYVAYNGTSMSAPHVAGLVATYLHQYPDATPAQVQEAIVNGAVANQLTAVPAATPNRLLNSLALPKPGDGDPVLDEPVAYIAPVPDSVEFGTQLVYDGTGSTDPGGSALTYAWTVDDSSEVIGTEPTLEYWQLERGFHDINLTVTNPDGKTDTTSYPVFVSIPDELPETMAKMEPSFQFQVAPGREVVFDGSSSWEPFGGDLTYRFLVTKSGDRDPSASGDGPTFAYAFPSEGTYSVDLIVTSEYGARTGIGTTVTVSSEPNDKAIIVPGWSLDNTIAAGTTITLDGSFSGYHLGSPAFENRTYEWYLFLDDKPSATGPTFTHTFETDENVTLVVKSTDADGKPIPTMEGVTSYHVVKAEPPTVSLSRAEVTVQAGQPVMLSGVGSKDPDGGPLSLAWTVSDAPDVVASDDIVFGRVFDTPGKYDVTFAVTDNEGETVSKSVAVTVTDAVPPPVALFTPDTDQRVAVGQTLTFDGSTSYDPDGGELTYQWRSTGLPGVVSDTSKYERKFDEPGRYGVELTVTDDEGDESTKHINVWVSKPTPPLATFTPATDQRILVGQTVTFDGSASNDPDGGELTYVWRSTGVSDEASDTSKYERKFDEPGRYGVELTVTDDEGESARKHINVWVSEPAPPVAKFTPGTEQHIVVGQTLRFDGSKSTDPDGGTLTYEWRSTGVSGLASKTSRYSRKFTAPGRYGVELTVIDDEGEKSKKHIFVVVSKPEPPVVTFTPGEDQRIVVGQTVRFDGSASNDPDGGSLTYQWRSTGVSGLASKTSRYSRKFTAPGRYGVELTVIDDEGSVARKHINVWVSKK